MRDLIIGIIIGSMITIIGLYHFSLQARLVKVEIRQEKICEDVSRIALTVGPLKGGKK